MLRKNDIKKYIELVYKKNLTYKQVADFFNVTSERVANFRVRHKLPKRGWANGHPMIGKKTTAWNKGIKGEDSYFWKGGKTISSSGYIFIYSPQHPSIKNSSAKYVGEHRLVMEKSINRFLKPYEHVHHKNGNKQDNRIENLELLSAKDHIRKHPDLLFQVGHIFHSRSLRSRTIGQTK